METLMIMLVIGNTFKWICFLVFALGIITMLYAPKENKSQRKLRKDGWDVDAPVFTFLEAGKKVLKKRDTGTEDEAMPVIWIHYDTWEQMPIDHCLYSEVWINDPPQCRRARRGEYVGFLDEKGEEIGRIQYVAVESFIDGKAKVKTQKDEYFIDIHGKQLP
jgi:hypothetical protein